MFSPVKFWTERGPKISASLIQAIVILFIGWVISQIIGKILEKIFASSRFSFPEILESYTIRAVKILILTIASIMAIGELGIQTGPLIAGLGITGFVMGFAMQQTLGNIAAGFMILLYRPYDIGNHIKVGELSGTVEEMNLSMTVIRKLDNTKMVIPNGKIWGDVITNTSEADTRRLELTLQVGYDQNLERVKSLVLDVMEDSSLVLDEPSPGVRAQNWGDFSVDLILWAWSQRDKFLQTREYLIREIKEKLANHDIGISPNPEYGVELKKRPA
ncbi:mechanosensitive ion channel [Candidatus Bipolaricaulota bacterium]|nr:mechanosensitive ion channel [Candidatus Bipolaricaulota bacterium]